VFFHGTKTIPEVLYLPGLVAEFASLVEQASQFVPGGYPSIRRVLIVFIRQYQG